MGQKLAAEKEIDWRIPKWFPDLSAEQIKTFQLYHSELLRFNQHINLIAKRTEDDSDATHFADCIIGGRAILEVATSREIYDIGSGNGFPGMVMAILDPTRKFHLLDSDSRKGEFLKHTAKLLKLDNVDVIVGRFEDLKGVRMECAVSRGFAPITKTLMIARKIFEPGGSYYHFKGNAWMREVAGMAVQLASFWQPELVKEYTLPNATTKYAVVVTKRLAK